MKLRTRKTAGILAGLFSLLVLNGPAHAVPGLVSYQGKLTDTSGTPLEKAQNIAFRIYDVASGGTPLWSETQNNVQVVDGIYSIQLGAVSPLSATIFAGDSAYLEVWIWNAASSSWEVLSPRQRLTSTVFAFRAGDADTVGGKTLAKIHAEETDPTVLASVKDGVAWGEVSGIPDGFADGADADSGGDITGVTAGTGLTGGGTTGSVTMSVNTSAIQQRVSGACAAGSSIRTVNADGTVVCETDDTGITSETDPQVGSISANFVPRWDGSALVSGAIYDNGSRIGLGTASPNEQLELTGNLRLPDSTATSGIIRSGANTLIHTYGSGNFFAGENAGNLTMTGSYNAAIGMSALHHNTAANYNTASGTYSLYFNTTGNSNTASGYGTLYSNVTGSSNTAHGVSALFGNTTGNLNTASGSNALLANTTGESNTASGADALRSNTTGNSNTASGYSALYSNTTGYSNVASGTNALASNTTGFENTAHGSLALQFNTSGEKNTASGFEALSSNTTGVENTASGYRALQNNTTGYSNVASGSKALAFNTAGFSNTASGAAALGKNTTGSDNTASGKRALFYNTTGFSNTASGSCVLCYNTTGNDNTASGINAGISNTVGSNNTFIGSGSNAAAGDLTNATAIGYGAVVAGSNSVRIGNDSVTQIGGQVAWTNLSDMRHKRDIADIGPGLEFITALRPVQFRMLDGNDRLDFGFIAQDIEALLGDDYNILGIDSDPDRTLSLRYTDFIAPMVKAMQEQQEQIEEQKKIIERQEGFMSAMRSEIEAMKQYEKSEIEALKAEISAIKAGR